MTTDSTLSFTPQKIDVLNDEQSVHIEWADRHMSQLPIQRLRTYCPCADCQGHGVGLKAVSHDATGILAVEAVGQYALQFSFNDGHQTGIYRFSYLRKLDPQEVDKWGSPESFGRGG